tara:strand:+ start:928 stop:1146 length:219 start_codon:yes stop_codon:yes gene_type:complete
MPGGSKKGGGLKVTPYKMKGHTLPGPNQSTAAKMTSASWAKNLEMREEDDKKNPMDQSMLTGISGMDMGPNS